MHFDVQVFSFPPCADVHRHLGGFPPGDEVEFVEVELGLPGWEVDDDAAGLVKFGHRCAFLGAPVVDVFGVRIHRHLDCDGVDRVLDVASLQVKDLFSFA